MSLYGALRSGVSGLFAQSQSMAMISDNIANVNTNGYKVSKARFSSLVTTAASPTLYSSGGVQSSVGREYDVQGLLKSSSISTDIAIDQSGFFTVTDSLTRNTSTGNWDITGDILYTRAGEFRPDKDGNLVNAAGFYLTGWPRNSTNSGYSTTNVQSAFNGINVATSSSNPIPTQNISLDANLMNTAATGDTVDAEIPIIDRQGTQKTLTLTFEKTGANTWDITATLAGGGQFLDPDAGLPAGMGDDANSDGIIDNTELTGAPYTDMALAGASGVAVGQITFNADGTLGAVTGGNGTGSVGVDGNASSGILQLLVDHDGALGTVSDAAAINIDFGTIGGNDGLTQYNGASGVEGYDQDGEQFGSLTGVSINEAGEVTALYSNGVTRKLYQVPVTTFNNPNGLQQKTGNVFIETDASGAAIAHVSGAGGAGSIAPSSIESSTVDLANEFTDMITTQRAYSASTKIITTADEMLDELIRTKR
ncbi:flagellar hook protein FlgE [Aestuariispira ectoiniformans]|uniref:flagellar hook protein FlgE n=1 Tax=Aestuariispira ectoiniformans TaxID=2775080 RepID=UPI00223B4C1F|nr:flagellar hook protein FlgE [Aestuariispira ectoiniformans]